MLLGVDKRFPAGIALSRSFASLLHLHHPLDHARCIIQSRRGFVSNELFHVSTGTWVRPHGRAGTPDVDGDVRSKLREIHDALLEPPSLRDAADANLVVQQAPQYLTNDGLSVRVFPFEVDGDHTLFVIEVAALDHR